MKETIISKLYLENYKLFDSINLDLENELNIFDGPNGYGKTSIFDAIEFIITGNIKRITDSIVLDGKLSYDSFVFAKKADKDVIIKAEIKRGKEVFAIVKKIENNVESKRNGKKNNPKKLMDITKTYKLPYFDIVELADEYLIKSEEQIKLQKEYFGVMSQNLYSLLYYVQQEDRLDYFKKSEKDRLGRINTLFQTEEKNKKKDDLANSKRKLNNIIKVLRGELDRTKESMDSNLENIPGHNITYKRFFSKEIGWDNAEPKFDSRDVLNEANRVLERISKYLVYQKEYNVNSRNKIIEDFLSSTGKQSYEAYILGGIIGDNLSSYIEKKEQLIFINNVLNLAADTNYLEIDFDKIEKYFDDKEKIHEIKECLDEYQQLKKSRQNTDSAINQLYRMREKLIAVDKEKISFDQSKCPYCGHDWKDQKILCAEIDKTTQELKGMLGGSERRLNNILKKIGILFDNNLKMKLEEEKIKYTSDNMFMRFFRIDDVEFEQKKKYVEDFLRKNQIQISKLDNEQMLDEQIEVFINEIKKNVKSLSEEYKVTDSQYHFEDLINVYFYKEVEINAIDQKDINEKMDYLRYYYNANQQTKANKVKVLEEKVEMLEGQIRDGIAQYEQDIKTSIGKYIGEIVSKIEIPFYLYSARILQSYQGGQGIIIRDSQKEEFETIRFTKPGGEHDILYTMSSGQLSGILLAYALVLNKMFAVDGINAIFIDDPVQCMDDLNIMSFVELLRTEFPQVQIIISTHEDSFANYISYKYKKYKMHVRRNDLKEISENLSQSI